MRIANSLAGILIDQSDHTKAKDLLSPIAERFPSSGSDLPDFIAAQELLQTTWPIDKVGLRRPIKQ